ncbi:oligopeptide/dipeptide ABC transporter ATP-binding protein [Treponema sp. SP13]|uniref:oligopeptide/dipeptide ABC transporter ATP-binding protein n=1 Tax=Treponema sp. SP13 TaxID=2789742 RepID=UPI003D8DE605
MSGAIIEVRHLSKTFSFEAGFFARGERTVYAVNDVSFSIRRGTTYGLVGESGCGKTTTARLLVGMYSPTSGEIRYAPEEGEARNIASYTKNEMRAYREKVKYIFQDPARSLNPRMNVYEILTSPLRYSSKRRGKDDAKERAVKIIKEVGMSEADLFRRPSEFSGGQRQRISIARSLIMEPEALICDEVISALDVSIQGQIINLLDDLRKTRSLSFLFITHDLKAASYFCDVIGVMYRGILVEEAPAADLYETKLHPYTKLLFDGALGKEAASNAEVKTTLEAEKGCPFAYRCPHVEKACCETLPELTETESGHRVRCLLVQ